MHLDDEANLQAAMGDLVQHINATEAREKSGVVYGVASIFHCAVVRVDKGVRGTSSTHASALQFLPSFYATKISTPGIEALSKLGQASGREFLSAISDALNLPPVTHSVSLFSRSVAAKLPVELWMKIGHFITAPIGLVCLSSISPQAMSVAADLAHYPSVMEFRLVDVVDCPPPIVENRKEYYHEDYRYYFERLGCAQFTAVKNGCHVKVELGQQTSEMFMDRRPMLIEIQTYLSGSILMNKIYIEEQEEEEKAY